MKKICISLICLTICLSATAQTNAVMQRAKDRVKQFEYNDAIKLLEKNVNSRTAKVEALEIVGDCYRLLGNKDRALTYYKKAIAMEGVSPEVYRYMGILLLSQGKYEEAKTHFETYINKRGTTDVQLQIATCDTAMLWIATKDSSIFQVSLLPRVNSRYSDWGPELFNGNLIFTSNRIQGNQKENVDNFYTIYQARGMRNNPNAFGPAYVLYPQFSNNNKHVGHLVFTKDKKNVFYAQTNTAVFHKKRTEIGEILQNNFEILTAKIGDKELTDIKPFKYNNSRKYSAGHPCLSPNNDVLYFASNMPGGYGNVDIYFCRRNAQGEWSAPQNCGPMINTKGDEMFPTMDSTGVLYFSSNGRIGLGGLDIYRAKGEGDQWEKVENMHYPLNSCGDDFHLTFSPGYKSGYFSSNRPGGLGSDDIYQVTLTGPMPDFGYIATPKTFENKLLIDHGAMFKGTVTAQDNGLPIEGASISFIDNVHKTQVICTTNSLGEFTTLLHKDRRYTYSCIHDGYVPVINRPLAGDDPVTQQNGISIVMSAIKAKEENVIAENVVLETTDDSTGIQYTVQVMAGKGYPNWEYLNKISEVYPTLKVFYASFPDAYTRFTVGRFTTIKEATKLKNELRQLGYSDAFVVMMINGERKVVSYN